MAEHWTCIECEALFSDEDGDIYEKIMCNKCIEKIYAPTSGERRDPDIRRSSTKHYPDWDMKKKEYIVPPKQRSKK